MLKNGDIDFFKVAEPLLAFRRRNSATSMVCLFNLSGDAINVTLDGDESLQPLEISRGAERKRSKLRLAPNGFAFLDEGAERRINVTFNARRKRAAVPTRRRLPGRAAAWRRPGSRR